MTGDKKGKQWLVPQEVMNQIKEELIDEMNKTERIIINDVKEGTLIEMESKKEKMDDLIQKALVVKTNFFNDKDNGRSYIG